MPWRVTVPPAALRILAYAAGGKRFLYPGLLRRKTYGIRTYRDRHAASGTGKGLARPKELALVGDPVPEGLSPFQKPDTIKLDFTNGVPKFYASLSCSWLPDC